MLARWRAADDRPPEPLESAATAKMSPSEPQGTTVLGVVLAGGQSRRMGGDKALLELDGVTLVERAVRRLVAICSRVVLADGGRKTLAGTRSVDDGPGQGPAAGILGAAEAHPGSALLVLACDLPRVPIGLLGQLASPTAGDWTVPRWQDRLEPLCALYRPAALEALRRQVERGVLAPHRLAERAPTDDNGLTIAYLEGEALRRHGDPAVMFTNLNRPQDLDRLRGNRSADRG